jgi:hypothetical protein
MQLAQFERTVACTIFGTIVPDAIQGTPRDAEVLALHEQALALMPPLQAYGVRAAFLAAALLAPLVLCARPRTLMALGVEDREECLARLVHHRRYLVRQLGLLLKMFTCLAYFQHEGVRRSYGLPPAADPSVPT